MSTKIEFAAVLDRASKLNLSSLPDLAIEWLIEGIESESLILLAGEPGSPDDLELRDLFRAALDELGIGAPTAAEATRILQNQIALEVTTGQLRPREGASRLMGFLPGFDENSALKLEEIERLYYLYEEDQHLSDVAQIDARIHELCEQLLTRVDPA